MFQHNFSENGIKSYRGVTLEDCLEQFSRPEIMDGDNKPVSYTQLVHATTITKLSRRTDDPLPNYCVVCVVTTITCFVVVYCRYVVTVAGLSAPLRGWPFRDSHQSLYSVSCLEQLISSHLVHLYQFIYKNVDCIKCMHADLSGCVNKVIILASP